MATTPPLTSPKGTAPRGTPPKGTSPKGTPPKGILKGKSTKPRTLQERNESKTPNLYDVGAVPGQILSTGMRLNHTSPEFVASVDFSTKQGLRQCVNCLECIQMRRTSWLTADCVDIPLSWAYKCQPRAVRHRINLLPATDSDGLFQDPEGEVVAEGEGGGRHLNARDEFRTDVKFQKKLEDAYKTRPKMWARIRAREFTIWPVHTTAHFVTILLRMRRRDPNGHPNTPYDEVAQFSILEPRTHRRLRRILNYDGITIPDDAFRGPWYPKQHDTFSCGIRAYHMAKEFMERLTWILEIWPVIFHMTNKPVVMASGGREYLENSLVRSPASSPASSTTGTAAGAPAPSRLRAEVDFTQMLWMRPFRGTFNGDRVRQEMAIGAAFRALEFYDWQGRVAVVAVDSLTDRDFMHDEEIRRKPGDKPPPVKVYAPNELRPRTGSGEPRIQRYKGQGPANPIQNPGQNNSPQVPIEEFAKITIGKKTKAGYDELLEQPGQKRRLTTGQWQRKNGRTQKRGCARG
ncbi:hypothetical protein PG994_012983 [Apiospora phragmitis]|uniref:Ubiquitin-like protease family profile domain-containing protein n=1 Tax=Apiospora phragmitis TaxID=2905665 RepID=A0ABR1T921_9PEZI